MTFEEIYQEFQPKITRYLCSFMSEEEALEVSQAVFLKVSQSLESFRAESSLSTWIYRIATNAAHDHASLSMTKQRRAEQLLDEDQSLDDFVREDDPETDWEYIRSEMGCCIRGMVDGLPEKLREVLVLSEFEGLSNAEIADVLKASLDTVKIRLHRARKALREAMGAGCDFYRDERNQLMCDRKAQ
ncbi:RNA polymerase sigma factor [Citrifermentans bemidjiense Bem]|uniref:RNA polymerase sigma factor n=1 Tax=Citrifermentans bemidjiense (strain ATCC BAA-1014 / DSM 16622 / JCM 12645 / Bem) TaxID=404380 RepID=B5E9H1_CITBB|nr:sigma-70 family RNA polymerase sigma factor [Citrifermentans bemidjiense]ACH38713.1 RNA polymerase sigma factor [Citrifermentans bemidjiense Bem]